MASEKNRALSQQQAQAPCAKFIPDATGHSYPAVAKIRGFYCRPKINVFRARAKAINSLYECQIYYWQALRRIAAILWQMK
ncbi:MAG: hypothetical protein WBF87_12120 [Mesorhizobium sp.]